MRLKAAEGVLSRREYFELTLSWRRYLDRNSARRSNGFDVKEVNLQCLQAGPAGPLADTQDSYRYAPSFLRQRFCVGLEIREGLLDSASTEVIISAKDTSKYIVIKPKILAPREQLTNHSRPSIRACYKQNVPTILSLGCVVAYTASSWSKSSVTLESTSARDSLKRRCRISSRY